MSEYLIESVHFQPDFETLARRLHVRPASSQWQELRSYLDTLLPIAHPKAFYKIAFINQKEADHLVIDSIHFHSRILCVNLAEVHRVFACIATCGTELAKQRDQEEDILLQFWADAIMEAAVRAAMEALQADIAARFQTGKMAVMNPGSLKDWPITEQKPFFQLLGEGAQRTGVVLNVSMLMMPAKSVTGLYFETESDFVNCQLCPRQSCPNRRAEYLPGLMDQKYQPKI